MVEVKGLNLIEEIVGEENLKKKIAKDIRKDKIKQLMEQGVDRKMAIVMVDAFDSCWIE